jgi:isopenicillin-N N-acyltransferase-like protein
VIVVRPDFASFTEAGILAKVGVSRHGIALTLNMLYHESDRRSPIGVPVHLLIREILGSCTSVDEVAELASSVEVSASCCLSIVSATGDAAHFEVTPAGVGQLEPDGDGLLAHANLVEAPGLASGDRGPDARSSLMRLAALRHHRPRTHDEARALLSSHTGGAGSICRHDEPQKHGLPPGGTIATVLLDPVAGTMEVGAGPPCRSEMELVKLLR